MNGDLKLKLQAWVDGELPGDEVRQVESLVSKDRDAAALANEIRMTRGFLHGNELEVRVPESPEFYWSKIRRGIEQADAADPVASAAPASYFWAALRRFMVPASGLALVMIVAALSVKYFSPDSLEDAALQQMVEVENLSEEMGSISYRSQADKMFVVYLYAKDQGTVEDETQADPLDELLFQ
jgi:anti-sigma factor RsiW